MASSVSRVYPEAFLCDATVNNRVPVEVFGMNLCNGMVLTFTSSSTTLTAILGFVSADSTWGIIIAPPSAVPGQFVLEKLTRPNGTSVQCVSPTMHYYGTREDAELHPEVTFNQQEISTFGTQMTLNMVNAWMQLPAQQRAPFLEAVRQIQAARQSPCG